MDSTNIPYHLMLFDIKGTEIEKADIIGAKKFVKEFGSDVKSVDYTVNFIINSRLADNKEKAEKYLDYMTIVPQKFKENLLSRISNNKRLYFYNDCFKLKEAYLDDDFNKGYKLIKVPFED